MLTVTFKSRSRSWRIWQECFDIGSDRENALMALTVAYKMHAEIIGASTETHDS